MKKKGFTLIELLAVIVILAIIALIATPLVLKYIEKSRKESKVDSAYSFVRNLETEIANYSIKHNGKKYNEQPSSGDYYELTDFEDKIDATVKGDNPSNGKVCLSSLGQVEKGIFEFNDGKYYVSYDGKKGSISDKDTYDNFSCSGNVADSDSNTGEEIFGKTITFTYDPNSDFDMSTATYDFVDGETISIVARKDYCVKIKDSSDVVVVNTCASAIQDGWAMANDEFDNTIGFIAQDNSLMINTMGLGLDGDYNMVISESDSFIPYSFRVENGYIWLYSVDFVAGEANVIIKDNDGNTYGNGTMNFGCSDGLCGGKSYDSSGLDGLDENAVYDAIANGKKLEIKVTQNDVETVIDGENVVSVKDKNTNTNKYYIIGNKNFMHAS